MRIKVGKFNENNITRYRPNNNRVSNYLNQMGSDFSDFDVYLWGSWPNKKTWDVDLLLARDTSKFDLEELENISLNSLKTSLKNNNFLADVGFSNRPITPFNKSMLNYQKNGKFTPNAGYVYGQEWYADDIKFKDRLDWKNGSVQPLSNNILKVGSSHPYPKQLTALQEGNFNEMYGNKPLLIKNRKKIYGL